jgi:hypothetical protein
VATINLGDIVALTTGALGELKKVYPYLTATDTFKVTRLDRAAGRKRVYMRKVRAEHLVVLAWPESLRVVAREGRPRRRT